jgi:ABC-type bacteriocin/lantibiotic exporter with double-glycine peptidase domain
LDEKSFKQIFEMNHSSVIDDRDLIIEMVSQDEITEKDQVGSYNTTKSAFKVSKVSKAFIKNDKNMIHNISFNLDKHQVMGILGPSGAGKSTIFKIMTMALRRDSGDISVLGNDFSNP